MKKAQVRKYKKPNKNKSRKLFPFDWKNKSVRIGGILALFVVIGSVYLLHSFAATGFPTSRDKYKWPFSKYSIWNMPIGSSANLVPAGIKAPYKSSTFDGGYITADTNPIALDPNAPIKMLNGQQARIPNTLSHDGSWNGCAAILSATDTNKI